jgi:hypothetical protein
MILPFAIIQFVTDLANAAQGGEFAASIEKRGVLLMALHWTKPADDYIPLWNYGKGIAIDILDFSINVEEP